jgi:hypothetical protein
MITIKNIKDYIQGNLRQLGAKFNLLEPHVKEQIVYRHEICKDTCGRAENCEECGCAYPGKLYVYESCNNGTKFPDIMEIDKWEKFKEENKITIED